MAMLARAAGCTWASPDPLLVWCLEILVPCCCHSHGWRLLWKCEAGSSTWIWNETSLSWRSHEYYSNLRASVLSKRNQELPGDIGIPLSIKTSEQFLCKNSTMKFYRNDHYQTGLIPACFIHVSKTQPDLISNQHYSTCGLLSY